MRNVLRTDRIFRLALAACLMLLVLQPAVSALAEQTVEGVVNLNTATEDELTRLPRVGPSVAKRIIAFREKNGPFQRAEELMNVQGIGEKTFSKLRPHVAVEGETTLKPAAAKKTAKK